MGKLTNPVAVVTGAWKGIGAGIARALAAEGASVVVDYSSSNVRKSTFVECAQRDWQQLVGPTLQLSSSGDYGRGGESLRIWLRTDGFYLGVVA